jgi:hypothetical protein
MLLGHDAFYTLLQSIIFTFQMRLQLSVIFVWEFFEYVEPYLILVIWVTLERHWFYCANLFPPLISALAAFIWGFFYCFLVVSCIGVDWVCNWWCDYTIERRVLSPQHSCHLLFFIPTFCLSSLSVSPLGGFVTETTFGWGMLVT